MINFSFCNKKLNKFTKHSVCFVILLWYLMILFLRIVVFMEEGVLNTDKTKERGNALAAFEL